MLALLGRTESYVLLTSQIWEVFYLSDEFDSFTDQLDLAWWAHPGGRNGRFTSDELNEAFGQYLLQVCHKLPVIETTTTLSVGSSEHSRNRNWLPLSRYWQNTLLF
jgi:hypothetical protein